jgi:signal transduction histidine kinase/CheY-like chemotaxis protein/ligand-binding sensor domain-containing protein
MRCVSWPLDFIATRRDPPSETITSPKLADTKHVWSACNWRPANKRAGLCSLVLLLLGPSPAIGLDPTLPASQYAIDHWNWSKGIPEETITGITQSPDGYLWIAHADGLVRFNGTDAIPSPWPAGRAMDRSLRAVSVDPVGAVWAMTVTGTLVRVPPSSRPPGGSPVEVIVSAPPKRRVPAWRAALVALPGLIRLSGPEGIEDYAPLAPPRLRLPLVEHRTAAAFAADGTLWTATAEGWLERWQPGEEPRRVARFPAGRPARLFIGASGKIWLRTGDALRSWHQGAWEEWPLSKEFTANSSYEAVFEDRHGTVWIGGRGCMSRLRKGRLERIGLPPSFENSPVTALYEDREGALWIGTLSGDLLRLRDSPVSSLSQQEGVFGDAVNALYSDTRGDLWMHSMNRGLTRWRDGQRKRIGLAAGNLWHLGQEPGTGALLVGNGPENFFLEGERLVPIPDADADILGARTGWWVDDKRRRTLIARHSGLHVQSSLRSTADRRKLSSIGGIKLLALGDQDRIWGSDLEGLWELTPNGERPLIPPGRQIDELIQSLHWDAGAGLLWVGTNRGLMAWKPQTGEWTPRGLPEDQIFSLTNDAEGSLWAGTRRGIVRVQKARWLAGHRRAELRLTHSDGLPSLNFGMSRGQGALALPDGQILFASLEGVVAVNPRRIPVPAFDPTPLIASITGGETKLRLDAPDHFPAGVSHVEIAFDAFSVSSPRPIAVEYLLEGIDDTWQSAGTRRSIQYNNLSPGAYRFRLRSSWADGAGQRETSYSWTIPPHFYQTAWFRGMSLALLLALVYFGIHRRTFRTAARTAELEAHVAERTRELEAAKAAAESAARVKSEFLATMSHELRTPMNGVLGIAELLSGTELDEMQRELLSTLRTSGESLLAVVNDILDLSKIDSGRLQIERIPTNLPALMADLCQVVKPMADKKGLELVLRSDGEAHDWIEGDPSRIRQILYNLLSNAIKFTPTGRVALQAEWRAAEVLLSVEDSGIGIPADKLPLLFENFVQVDSSTTRLYGGTGLGLAICRRLVEAMGGSISCASTPGQGSTFTVCLPVAVALAPSAAVNLPDAKTPAGLRVLVAEDNRTNQRVILGLLSKIGVEALLVSNGMEAVDACQRERFDLVLMDCQMPILDGYGATRHIRQNLGSAAPPIVALTAHALESDRADCFAAGMCGYLTKPVLLDQLRLVINEHSRTPVRR